MSWNRILSRQCWWERRAIQKICSPKQASHHHLLSISLPTLLHDFLEHLELQRGFEAHQVHAPAGVIKKHFSSVICETDVCVKYCCISTYVGACYKFVATVRPSVCFRLPPPQTIELTLYPTKQYAGTVLP